MDIRELKTLLKNSASVLVLDDGEPAYVILDYDVYRNMTKEQGAGEEVPISRNSHAPDQPEQAHQSFGEQNLGGQAPSVSPAELEAIERLNKEIQALRDQIEQEERALSGENQTTAGEEPAEL